MAVAALRVDADVRVRAGLQKGSGHGDVTPGACHNERGLLPAVAGVDEDVVVVAKGEWAVHIKDNVSISVLEEVAFRLLKVQEAQHLHESTSS